MKRPCGKKPYNDNGVIAAAAGEQRLQFNSNDGNGYDYNVEKIHIFLLPKGEDDSIKPDASNGWTVPNSQFKRLKEKSVYAVEIIRKANTFRFRR